MILALLLVAGEFVNHGFSRGIDPVVTGAPPALLSAKACATCHAAAHADWKDSRHARAWTNPIFVREFRQEPLEWCVHCHAPLSEQQDEIRAAAAATEHRGQNALAAEGVNCAVCHLREGRMQASQRHAGSPHDTVVREDFGSPAFCAGCHQFNFPRIEGSGAEARVVGFWAHPMQDTVAQHASGPLSATPCRACHATSTGRHAYPGGHEPSMLTRALALETCRQGRTLRMTVSNVGAGHNVPTGDLHRHLVLRAWRPSAPERLFEALFGRQFEADPAGGKRPTRDTTLPAGTARVIDANVAALGAASPDEPIRVELRFVYTIDEFPFQGHELAEPTSTTVVTRDLDWRTLPSCAAPRAVRPDASRR